MIQKAEVGNRIAVMRRQQGLSQTAFAQKLSVSPQAVSKWETGAALPDVEVLLGISRLFGISINEILEGRNILYRLASCSFVMEDIAYFGPKEERACDVEWAQSIVEGGWTRRNWEHQKSLVPGYRHVAQKIIAHGGTILEIGTGPGGGFMPAILLEQPEASVIISDLSPTVVREWKKLFDDEFCPPNVYYAALDNCNMPFADGSIDVISAGGGFGNTEGDKFKALTEIYRVLKVGGLYVSGDGFVTKEMLKSLPTRAQQVLLEKRPDIFEDYYAASVMAGFETIDNIIFGGWSTRDDQSDVADLARRLGVELTFTSYLRYCTK